jgi:hypothetical protein
MEPSLCAHHFFLRLNNGFTVYGPSGRHYLILVKKDRDIWHSDIVRIARSIFSAAVATRLKPGINMAKKWISMLLQRNIVQRAQ